MMVLQQPFCNHEVTRQKAKQSRAEIEQKYGSSMALLSLHQAASSESFIMGEKQTVVI